MTRRPVKRDANHAEILRDLRRVWPLTQDLSHVGFGVPDLAVPFKSRGMTVLIEVKRPGPPSARRLTPHEALFMSWWAGPIVIAQSSEEAITGVIDALGSGQTAAMARAMDEARGLPEDYVGTVPVLVPKGVR